VAVKTSQVVPIPAPVSVMELTGKARTVITKSKTIFMNTGPVSTVLFAIAWFVDVIDRRG
jgi:hypothetical protein